MFRDSTTAFMFRPIPSRPRFGRPRNAARSDTQTVLCGGISGSAGGSRRCGVSSDEANLESVLEPNAGTGSRSWPSSTAIVPLSSRRRRGCSGRTPATPRLEQSLHEIAEQVKVRGRKDPQADVFKQVHDWLRDARNGPWLVIVDNADDVAALALLASNGESAIADDGSNDSSNALKQPLSRYLPPSRHDAVLVTSRTRRTAMQIVEESNIIPIEPMHDAVAHALRNKLGDKAARMMALPS